MGLTAARNGLVPALVVPDEQSWTVWGQDPARLGLEPVLDPSAARRVLAPEAVPGALAEALRNWLGGSASALPIDERPAPLGGDAPRSIMAGGGAEPDGGHHGHDDHGGHGGHGGHDQHDEHDEHGGHGGHHADHDHGDMMAITGEPSADGLVMEPIELRYGPLGTALPGGLIADVTLDGDVVAASTVRSLLEARPGDGSAPSPPDPLSPAAWTAALHSQQPPPWTQLAEVELERAVSHLAWLRAFGRLLAWQPLVNASAGALVALDSGKAEQVVSLLQRDRAFGMRTRGVGRLTAEEVRARGLRGIAARASGVPDDARAEGPLYERLEFEPLVASDGDAFARALLRAREAVQSIALAAAARERAQADDSGPAGSGRIEGPRGPLVARREASGWQLSAPGSEAARRTAGELMVGLEWSSALVTLASFDLSPWLVPG